MTGELGVSTYSKAELENGTRGSLLYIYGLFFPIAMATRKGHGDDCEKQAVDNRAHSCNMLELRTAWLGRSLTENAI